jgi:hypothetical protein
LTIFALLAHDSGHGLKLNEQCFVITEIAIP